VTTALWPTVHLYADFAGAPLSSHSNPADIAGDLVGFQTHRGRDNTASTFDVGSCTLVLDNTLGQYGPTYTQTPWAGNIQPMKWMRLWCVAGAAVPNIFEGYVDGWTLVTSGTGEEYVTVTLSDAFKILNLFQWTGGSTSATTDQRIQTVEQLAGFTSFGHLDTGLSTVPAILAPANLNGLQHCQDVANTEDGQYYIGMHTPTVGAAGFVFESRYHRSTASRSTTSQATLIDDGTGTIDYEDNQSFAYDDSQIWTSSTVTDGNGDTFTYTDTSSAITNYLNRTQTVSILTTAPNEGADRAAWTVQSSLGQLNQVRIDGITVDPVFAATASGTTTLWQTLLSLDISDRVTVKRTAPPSTLHGLPSNQITGDFFIERIDHSVSLADGYWQVTFGLSAVTQTAPNWLIIGTGKLGTTGGANTAVLGY